MQVAAELADVDRKTFAMFEAGGPECVTAETRAKCQKVEELFRYVLEHAPGTRKRA